MRLWEKYRPSSLSELVGQPCLAALREFAASPYSCCLLFEGPPGTGKTASALALAADVGCKDQWSGLEIVPSVDLTIERCRELFERTLRIIPMAGNGWRVLVVEELEACSSVQVQRYLKVMLDTGLPPKLIVIATSNGTDDLDPALVQRFDQYLFRGDETLARYGGDHLRQIWFRETGGEKLPGDPVMWGWTGERWSFRTAMKVMQQHLALHDRRLVPMA